VQVTPTINPTELSDVSVAAIQDGLAKEASVSSVLTAVQNVQNNTFIGTNIPSLLERPDIGSKAVVIRVVFNDETGTPKNLDTGNPIVALVDETSTDLTGRLGSWTNPATGEYVVTYTNSSTDAIATLDWNITGTVNSKLRRWVGKTQIVDTTAIDFTSTDRTNLGYLLTRLGTPADGGTVAGKTDKIGTNDGDSTAAKTAQTAISTNLNAPVGSIPTNPLLANSNLLPATVIAAKTDVQITVTPTINPTVLSDGSIASIKSGLVTTIELTNALSGLSVPTGARTVTLTVTDADSNLLPNARIRLTSGVESYLVLTGDEGVVTFNLDDAVWTVGITKALYQFTPTTLTVAANVTHTYVMTAMMTPGSDPGFITGYLYCYDEKGIVEENVIVQVKLESIAGSGISYDSAERSELSDVNGLATFTNLTPGATYTMRRGTESDWRSCTIPSNTVSPYALPNLIGEDD
jgi:hypothetical protein